MSLPGIVQPARSGLLGFDTDSVVSASVAKQFFQQGYRFCGRYLSHGDAQAAGDLSQDEATAILEAGLALFVVQHVLHANWSPSSALGTTSGTNAVKNAQSVGLPTGINLWCDLEGVKPGTPVQDIIDYCKAWHVAVSAGQLILHPALF